MIFKVFRYISFCVNSVDQHSVHSPIVYKLLTDCIYKMDKKLFLKDMSIVEKSILHKYQDEFKVSYVDNIFAADISEFTTKGDTVS